MKKNIKLTIYIAPFLLLGCSNGFNNIQCVSHENPKWIKNEILSKVDSVISTTDFGCRKYNIVNYKCETDTLLEVKVKTKCDEKYFLFNEKIKLLKVITVLKEFN